MISCRTYIGVCTNNLPLIVVKYLTFACSPFSYTSMFIKTVVFLIYYQFKAEQEICKLLIFRCFDDIILFPSFFHHHFPCYWWYSGNHSLVYFVNLGVTDSNGCLTEWYSMDLVWVFPKSTCCSGKTKTGFYFCLWELKLNKRFCNQLQTELNFVSYHAPLYSCYECLQMEVFLTFRELGTGKIQVLNPCTAKPDKEQQLELNCPPNNIDTMNMCLSTD